MVQRSEVDDPSDARLADFAALNEPARRRQLERAGGYFVVEGILAIERLLTLPEWSVRRLALLPKVADRLREQIDRAGMADRVVVADEAVLAGVVGFDIHRGALASVDRRAPLTVSALAGALPPRGRPLLVAAEGLNDHENLGALYRNAAAFGAGGVVLDHTSADPFYRRSIRVSLGHVLGVPTAAMTTIDELHAQGITTVALTPSAAGSLAALTADDLGTGPVAVIVGAEGPGLAEPTLAAAHHRVAIPMAADVDSLNVATAVAVALFHVQALTGA